MKKLVLATSLLIFGENFSQNINDNEFKNVIEIECARNFGVNKNIKCWDFYTYKKPIIRTDLLIDVAIPSSEKIPVISVLPEIPTNWFEFLFPQFSEIIFITPNHELNRNREGKKGEPPVSSIIYHIKRPNNTTPIVKKRVIENDYPLMDYNYTDSVKYKEEGKIKVYYSEIENNSAKKAIKEFENQFKKKINFVQKKGEKRIYYTLEELTKDEKLEFLLHRSKANYKEDKQAKIISIDGFRIFTPYWIDAK